LDANAVVTAIETVSADEEVAIEEVVEDMANTIGEMKKQFDAMEAEIATLKAENVELKKHFDKTPSKPKTEKQPTWKNFSK
jgi:regulator of replication initiation timing